MNQISIFCTESKFTSEYQPEFCRLFFWNEETHQTKNWCILCQIVILLQFRSISSSLLLTLNTMFQNCRKSLISQSQQCERSELRLHFGQKLIKNAKNGQFGEFLKNWSWRSNSATRQVNFNETKIGWKCQNSNATFWVIFKQCV